MKKKSDKAKVLEVLHQLDPTWSGNRLKNIEPVTLSEADSAILAKCLSSKKKRIAMSEARRMPGDVIRDGGGYDLSLAKESVGKGWHGILERLFAAKPDWITVIQVKEKFGGLRFYLDDGSVRVDFIGVGSSIEVPGESERYSAEQVAALQTFRSVVQEAETESYTICEICGAPGKPESVGWISTLCPPCRDKRKAERVARYGVDDGEG